MSGVFRRLRVRWQQHKKRITRAGRYTSIRDELRIVEDWRVIQADRVGNVITTAMNYSGVKAAVGEMYGSGSEGMRGGWAVGAGVWWAGSGRQAGRNTFSRWLFML